MKDAVIVVPPDDASLEAAHAFLNAALVEQDRRRTFRGRTAEIARAAGVNAGIQRERKRVQKFIDDLPLNATTRAQLVKRLSEP